MSKNGIEVPPVTTSDDGYDPIAGKYKTWFLDYASYVILDRAVPTMEDGLKPVQRRLLYALKEMDDGRFHKVANLVGQTMQFHPHGDASIYEALVNLGQKNLMVETQGNWGDFRTGDKAAAARYIEARLSKFALEVAFNSHNTEWQLSYDGRKKEPVFLPVKFPLLLAQGVEGIAVGLSTKILPHNFIELLKASIQVLKGRKTKLLPDFPTGGMADFSNYNEGKRGGRVRVRAKIDLLDKKTLKISNLPYTVTTTNLIDSVLKANDKNKIKIKRITDNTAKEVEILVEIPPGVSPDVTVDALYAFTNCEVSIAPNCCVIQDEKPVFITVNELLKLCTEHTLELLRKELEIRLAALEERLHFASLEKIFIENRIYRDIEECKTFEAVIKAIDKGLKPFTKQFIRPITEEDIIRLTEIKIKRISKYDSFKADDLIKRLEEEIKEIKHHLANLVTYAITYYTKLIKKYGKGRERKTEIRSFDTINAKQVVIANQKLYVNRKDGFIGYGLKKDEFVRECSDLSDVVTICKNGILKVSRVGDKVFVGKNILYVDVWKKGEDRKIYHAVYYDGKTGRTFIKRFAVTAITRDKEYPISQGTRGSKLLYLAVHPNSEAEIITVVLSPTSKAKSKVFDFDFAEILIKGRTAKGNILTRYPVKKITQKSLGSSTMGGRKIWFDEIVGRLNTNERGVLLGEFDTDDKILVLLKDGQYEFTSFEMTNRYEMNKITSIEKFRRNHTISAIYHRPDKKAYYVKRFKIEDGKVGQKYDYIGLENNYQLTYATTQEKPYVEYDYRVKRNKFTNKLDLETFIDLKGWKSLGNKLTAYKITAVRTIAPEGEEQGGKKSEQGKLF